MMGCNSTGLCMSGSRRLERAGAERPTFSRLRRLRGALRKSLRDDLSTGSARSPSATFASPRGYTPASLRDAQEGVERREEAEDTELGSVPPTSVARSREGRGHLPTFKERQRRLPGRSCRQCACRDLVLLIKKIAYIALGDSAQFNRYVVNTQLGRPRTGQHLKRCSI